VTPDDHESLKVPLDDYTRAVAKEAAHEAVMEHVRLCSAPARLDLLEIRVRRIEIGYAAVIGTMLGSGLVGGLVGGLLSNLLP